MTACFIVNKEFCRREMTAVMKQEMYQVMESFAKAPGAPSKNDMKSQYAKFQNSLGTQKVC